VWQLKGSADPNREARAVRLIGLAFLGLAVYMTAQSAITLVSLRPDSSTLGMAWLTATVAVMLGLAAGKHDTGRHLNKHVLLTEAKVTLVDGALAAAILTGVALNATIGWWWADIAAGAVLVAYGLREGLHALRTPPD
jgi:divalent metal cation (Fe/Co/Zn/Cd) transporter